MKGRRLSLGAACGLMLVAISPLAAELEAASAQSAEEHAAQHGNAVERVRYEIVEPEYVRALTTLEPGRNDSNPVWSPNGQMLAFERSQGDKREIVIRKLDGGQVQTIYFQLSGQEKESKQAKFFMPGLSDEPSYNSGVSWARDAGRVAFMSNGGEGNYDLYSQVLGGAVQRLTDDKEKDGLADWSPTSSQIAFVSGRSGHGDVYLLDPEKRTVRPVTRGSMPHLYPKWSPDGKRIAFIFGSTENHDIYVIDDLSRPFENVRQLTRWTYDDLRPTWSPDGKQIAFYTNYNPEGDSKRWSLVVIHADGRDGVGEQELATKIVATDVIPDIEQGPAWLADGSGLVFVRNDELEYNPIHIIDLANRKISQIKTDTKMNHDIACGPQGLIAFRAQHEQWDQIFVAKLRK